MSGRRLGRGRAVDRAVAAAGLLLALGSVPASSAAAQVPSFGGYEGAASGVAMTVAPRVPALLPVETPFEGTVSLAFASLSTGGLGFGRASTVWPGTLFVGLRPLLEIGAGQSVPLPDYPLVVESREYEDAKQSDVPGTTMRSDVEPEKAEATANTAGFNVPAVVRSGSTETVSTSLLADGRITATARTFVSGIDIAGVVHIESVESIAEAATDSITATCGGSTTVTGATIGGTPVTVTEEGIVVDEGEPVVPGVPTAPLAEAVAASGVEMRLLGGVDACAGSAASRTTGGLLVSVPSPAVGAISAGRLDFIIGSTAATASASAPFDLRPVAPPPTLPTLGNVVPRVPGPATGGFAEAPVSPSVSPSPAAGPGAGAPGAPAVSRGAPVSHAFDGVPVPLVAGLFLVAVPGARRVRRYLERLMNLSATT